MDELATPITPAILRRAAEIVAGWEDLFDAYMCNAVYDALAEEDLECEAAVKHWMYTLRQHRISTSGCLAYWTSEDAVVHWPSGTCAPQNEARINFLLLIACEMEAEGAPL